MQHLRPRLPLLLSTSFFLKLFLFRFIKEKMMMEKIKMAFLKDKGGEPDVLFHL